MLLFERDNNELDSELLMSEKLIDSIVQSAYDVDDRIEKNRESYE